VFLSRQSGSRRETIYSQFGSLLSSDGNFKLQIKGLTPSPMP
jgi:hypothetical protein